MKKDEVMLFWEKNYERSNATTTIDDVYKTYRDITNEAGQLTFEEFCTISGRLSLPRKTTKIRCGHRNKQQKVYLMSRRVTVENEGERTTDSVNQKVREYLRGRYLGEGNGHVGRWIVRSVEKGNASVSQGKSRRKG